MVGGFSNRCKILSMWDNFSMSSDSSENNSKSSNEGHRKRLRDRFLQGGLNSFLDYEIVELLLTLGTPRKDCKPIAKNAIEKFSGLRNVLDATLEDLQKVNGIGPSNAFGLKLFQAVSERLSKEYIPEKLEFNSEKKIVDYLQNLIGREQKEHFIAIYIDTKNQLIETRTISIGILNSSLVHPREVFEPAISLRAASIIVAHNHPSGSVEPSSEDREITKRLIETGRIVGIEIRDHLIISKSEFFSFRQQLLI